MLSAKSGPRLSALVRVATPVIALPTGRSSSSSRSESRSGSPRVASSAMLRVGIVAPTATSGAETSVSRCASPAGRDGARGRPTVSVKAPVLRAVELVTSTM